jgi:hypothetical protein
VYSYTFLSIFLSPTVIDIHKQYTMADHKSSIISALVSQMKTGQISKNDLFEQLSTLQRPQNSTSYDDDDDNNINSNNDYNEEEESYPQTNDNNSNNNRSGKQTVSMEQFMASRNTPKSARRAGQNRDRSGSTSSRQERRELEIKMQNMKECTFQPQITELPKGYASNNNLTGKEKHEFHHRMSKWKDRKEQQLRRERDRKEQAKMDDCTFHPKINKTSRRTASLGRRDYKDVVERLYSQKKKSRVNEEDIRAKREEEFRRTCTFQPNLGKKANKFDRSGRSGNGNKSFHQRSQTPRGRSRKSDIKPTGMEECTFKPKVNRVPRKFGSAQLYLQNNVHDRLSTPRAARGRVNKDADEGADGGYNSDNEIKSKAKPVMNMDSFMSSLNANGGNQRPQSARRSRPGETKLNRAQFQNFLARQNKRQTRKSKNVARLKAEATPSHQPALCKRSLKLAKKTTNGDFMTRLAKDALRKEHENLRKKAMLAKEPDCTFTPNILASSRARRPRSVTELSRGDSLKRETAARLMKLKAEQDELEGLTFKPRLNPSNAQGKLRVVSNPESYLERVQKEQEIFSDKRRKAAQEQERKQFAECTFHPKTNDAPAYIKRIAKSMALARKARPSQKKSAKPDWK